MTRRSLWKLVQLAIAMALVIFVARDLVRNWQEVAAQPPVWRIRPLFLVGAACLTWAAYFGLIWSWRALLAAWGRPIGALEGARVWALASLGRYIPGKVWTIAGMAMLSQKLGVPLWMSTVAAVLLQLVAISTGIVAAALTGRGLLAALDPGLRWGAIAVAVVAAVGTVVLAAPAVFKRIARLVPGGDAAQPPPIGALGVAALANLGAWFCYGAAFWLVARGTLRDPGLTLSAAVAGYTTSYLLGFLAAFAPGGIGVRESVLIVVLRDVIGLGPAAGLAIASRFFITVVELGFVVPFALTRPGGEPPSGRPSDAALEREHRGDTA